MPARTEVRATGQGLYHELWLMLLKSQQVILPVVAVSRFHHFCGF
jgi:hypothetical protein